MSGFLFDTNVLLDLVTQDERWFAWSDRQFRMVIEHQFVLINPIIYAELAPAFGSPAELDRWLDLEFIERCPLPYAAGWLAAQAFLQYRSIGGNKTAPLPDFFIGAHAEVENLTLITRDPTRYRTYFPNVALITP